MINQGRTVQFAAPDTEKVATWTQQLREHGFCIIRDAVQQDLAARLNRDLDTTFSRTPFCEGGFYGYHTKRFGALLTRSQVAAGFIRHQLILAIAERLLGPWCDRFNLNLTQGIEIHSGAPAQYPHRDQDMWQGAKGGMEYLINVIWPLSEFTAANGATLVWPGSHRPEMHDQPPSGDPVVAEMAPGTALVFLGSALHGAGANRTGSIRRAIIVSYCLGWLKPFENQWLCYPPEIARHFEPELARLVGYSLHRPNLGNYEGQDPTILLAGNVPQHLAAVDALRPEQQEALAAYLAEQANEQGEAARGAETPAAKPSITRQEINGTVSERAAAQTAPDNRPAQPE